MKREMKRKFFFSSSPEKNWKDEQKLHLTCSPHLHHYTKYYRWWDELPLGGHFAGHLYWSTLTRFTHKDGDHFMISIFITLINVNWKDHQFTSLSGHFIIVIHFETFVDKNLTIDIDLDFSFYHINSEFITWYLFIQLAFDTFMVQPETNRQIEKWKYFHFQKK